MARLWVALVAGLALVSAGVVVTIRSQLLDASTAGPALSRDDVRQAQAQLHARHLYDGPVDGVLGQQTQAALRRYQQASGLPESATLDSATVAHLTGGPTPSPTPSPAPTDSGSSGTPRARPPAGARDATAPPR
jgi:peptidoglycan hydrolase-like protein with peptidoglycan-binding domain